MNHSQHIKSGLLKGKQFEKTDYRGKINLSSNELFDSNIAKIASVFFGSIDSSRISQYPYYRQYREEYACYFNIPEDNISFCAGSDTAINLILQVICSKSKRLILQSPNYYNYERYADLYGIKISRIENNIKEKTHVFPGKLRKAAGSAPPSLIVITNPCGISGRMLDCEQIRSILKYAVKFNHVVLIDEAYVSFSDSDHLSLLFEFDNLLIIRTLSKFPGMAGLRLAIIFGSRSLVEIINKVNPANTVSWITLEYYLYLLQRKRTLIVMRNTLLNNKAFFIKQLKNSLPHANIYNTGANFILVDLINRENVLNFISRCDKNDILLKNMFHLPNYETFIRITVPGKNIIRKLVKAISEI